VPHLAVFKAILPSFAISFVIFHALFFVLPLDLLAEESKLGTDAEVGDREENDLFEHGVPAQFVTVVNVEVEFFEAHRKQVHNITDIQIEDPVVLVFDA